jgi:hypothetical protein
VVQKAVNLENAPGFYLSVAQYALFEKLQGYHPFALIDLF